MYICIYVLPTCIYAHTLLFSSSVPSLWQVPLSRDFPRQSASVVAQLVKNPSAMWKIWVQSLGWEDALEKRSCRKILENVFWPGEFWPWTI